MNAFAMLIAAFVMAGLPAPQWLKYPTPAIPRTPDGKPNLSAPAPKTADGKPETAQVVNLLVTPDQAETLNLASIETKVQLVLRNPLDTEEEITHGTSIAGLFGATAEQRPAALGSPIRLPIRRAVSAVSIHRDPDVNTIEVFTGTKKTEQKFEIPQENK